MKGKKLILFGAGRNGIAALKKYGADCIACFCDNSKEKQGTSISGIRVVSFDEMISLYHEGYMIMLTPANHALMIGQLELKGIYDYLIFRDEHLRFPLETAEKEHDTYKHENEILDMLVAQSKKYDLLGDISDFAKLSKKALKMSKESNRTLVYHRLGEGESNFYGNLQAIMRYAEIPKKDMKYYPQVSHHSCMLLYTPAFDYKSAVIMPGSYYKKKIHARAPYVPVFSIGPYIHYAEGIYNIEKQKQEKQKIGKMLLIFLPHTIENVGRGYSRKAFIDDVLREYGDRFQSIWCCVYWADTGDPICGYAESKGIHIVTAGFRFDSEFNRRLKTILELADAVIVGDIGTFVAYALYMGKPIGRLDISDKRTLLDGQCTSELERKLQMADESFYEDTFYKVFDKEFKNTGEQREWMNEISGFDQIKDAEYIRYIFEISKDIWKGCEGDLFKYPETVRHIYSDYEKHLEFEKMTILKDAVGAYVN